MVSSIVGFTEPKIAVFIKWLYVYLYNYVHIYIRSQLTTYHITYFDRIRIKHLLWFNIREIVKPIKADYVTSFGMMTLKYLNRFLQMSQPPQQSVITTYCLHLVHLGLFLLINRLTCCLINVFFLLNSLNFIRWYPYQT